MKRAIVETSPRKNLKLLTKSPSGENIKSPTKTGWGVKKKVLPPVWEGEKPVPRSREN